MSGTTIRHSFQSSRLDQIGQPHCLTVILARPYLRPMSHRITLSAYYCRSLI